MPRHLIVRAALLSTVSVLLSQGAAARQMAGPKPESVQSGPDAGCLGSVEVGNTIGVPRVASGVRSGLGWDVDSISPTPAICSFPSAQPVDVQCKRNGLAVDASYCQASQFRQLLAQGYKTVGNTTNWSVARWILPGQTDSGCVGQWRSVEGERPMACGEVDVPVVSTCVVTNVQSGTPDDPERYCTSPRPASSRKDRDTRGCGYAIETGGWSDYSGSCGPVIHSRSLTCRRADGQPVDMSDSNCVSALGSYCLSHTCTGSGAATRENESVQLETCRASSDDLAYVWRTAGWVSSGQTCGMDLQTRSVSCVDAVSDVAVDPSQCDAGARPIASRYENVTSGCSSQTCSMPGSSGVVQTQLQDGFRQCAESVGRAVGGMNGLQLQHVLRQGNGDYVFCHGDRGVLTLSCTGGILASSSEAVCSGSHSACTAPAATSVPCEASAHLRLIGDGFVPDPGTMQIALYDDGYQQGGYVGVPIPLAVLGHLIVDPDIQVTGLYAVDRTNVRCGLPGSTPTPSPTPTP